MAKIESNNAPAPYQKSYAYNKQKLEEAEQLIMLDKKIKTLENFRCANGSFNEKKKELYLERGQLLMEQKKYQLALSDFEKAEEYNSKDRNVFFNQALANYQLKNFDKAKTALNKFIEICNNKLFFDHVFHKGLDLLQDHNIKNIE